MSIAEKVAIALAVTNALTLLAYCMLRHDYRNALYEWREAVEKNNRIRKALFDLHKQEEPHWPPSSP